VLSVSSIGTNELQPRIGNRQRSVRIAFQFPLSERTNCNLTDDADAILEDGSFSFLYRNERTATSVDSILDSPDLILSVSSIGTNELQQQNVCAGRGRTKLSVSSIGTNELQPSLQTIINTSGGTFSFLYRNERTATFCLRRETRFY